MFPTGPAATAPGSAPHDADVVASLMTGQEPLVVALGALLGKPMTLVEYPPPWWPAAEHRAAREDLHASHDDRSCDRHQLILTAADDDIFFHGYLATTWLPSRVPPIARLLLAIYAHVSFEQVVEPMRLTSRPSDYQNLGHTQIRRRVLSGDDGVPVAVVLELMWTRDGVHLAPACTPRPQHQRRHRRRMAADVTSFPELLVSLHLQRAHGERAAR